VPAELIAAARRHGLPMVEVPMQTPFIAISRAVSRAVAADEYAAVTRTFTAQQALTKAALSPAGPEQVVRLLARQMTGWVVLLDPSGAPIAAAPDTARSKAGALVTEMRVLAAHRGSVSSSFPLGADTVSMQSVGAGPPGRAFLAVGRPGQLTAADRHLVNAAVLLLTIRLEQSSGTENERGRLRSAVLRLVLAGQVELARPIADALGSALPAPPVTVVVAIGDRPTADLLIDPSAAGAWPLLAEIDDTLVALFDDGQDAAAAASRLVSTSIVAVGISDPVGYEAIAAGTGRQVRRPTSGDGTAGPSPHSGTSPCPASPASSATRRLRPSPSRCWRRCSSTTAPAAATWSAHCGSGSPITGSGTRRPGPLVCTGTPCGTG